MLQATPAADATMTALQKEQLTQQVAGQQHTWGNWLWINLAIIVSSFLSALVVVGGVLFGFWQWRVNRNDTQKKESDDRKAAQAKELEDRNAERERRNEEQQRWLKNQEAEREKRAEERFQAAVMGLGDTKDGVRVGAAILLRTFLGPGYEQFYTQTFDLAVAHLRLYISSDMRLTTLRQALIIAFKEAFPLARGQMKGGPEALDATDIQLDLAYLWGTDLCQVWMPQASLRQCDLRRADLRGAKLTGADLRGAKLADANLSSFLYRSNKLDDPRFKGTDRAEGIVIASTFGMHHFVTELRGAKLMDADLSRAKLMGADLSEADLSGANLTGADLSENAFHEGDEGLPSQARLFTSAQTNLEGANLSAANLSGADLTGAHPELAISLKDTNLRGAKGLTKEQLATCKAKGAIIDEDLTTGPSQSTITPPPPAQSNGTPASSNPPARRSVPIPNTDVSSTPPSPPSDLKP